MLVRKAPCALPGTLTDQQNMTISPGRSTGEWSCHELDHCDFDIGGCGVGISFEVPCQASVDGEPGEGSFDDPAFGKDLEPSGPVGSSDDLKGSWRGLLGLGSGVGTVGEDHFEKREARRQLHEQPGCAVPVEESPSAGWPKSNRSEARRKRHPPPLAGPSGVGGRGAAALVDTAKSAHTPRPSGRLCSAARACDNPTE